TDVAREDEGAAAIAPEPAATPSGWRRIPLAGARDEAVRASLLQRRADARREAALQVELTSIDASRDPATGAIYFATSPDERTENLSRRGMCLRCERPPAIGARVLLQLRIPGEAPVDMIGQARWTRVEFEPGLHGARAFARVGIELLGGAPRALERYDRALGRLATLDDTPHSAVASSGGHR
ncbi:MAG: PilZ domain-containing protein, partial [bacterium]